MLLLLATNHLHSRSEQHCSRKQLPLKSLSGITIQIRTVELHRAYLLSDKLLHKIHNPLRWAQDRIPNLCNWFDSNAANTLGSCGTGCKLLGKCEVDFNASWKAPLRRRFSILDDFVAFLLKLVKWVREPRKRHGRWEKKRALEWFRFVRVCFMWVHLHRGANSAGMELRVMDFFKNIDSDAEMDENGNKFCWQLKKKYKFAVCCKLNSQAAQKVCVLWLLQIVLWLYT